LRIYLSTSLPPTLQAPFEEMMKLGRIALKVDSMIEPHPYNPKDFKNKYDPLASEIKKTGIKIT